MKLLKTITTTLLILFSITVYSQGVGISNNGATPDNSAMLDVSSTEKGFLMPRMTTAEIEAITTPATGLLLYNTDFNKVWGYNGSEWRELGGSSCPVPAQPGSISGNSTVVENATGEAYSIAAVPDATAYTWAVPAGATIATGQGTTNITVDFGTTSGNITVYATNACGNSAERILAVTLTPAFVCGTSTVTDIDGNVYNTVQIGSQCWLQQDLKVTHYPNGDVIPEISDISVWAALADDNISDGYYFYGFTHLYSYSAAIGDDWVRDNNVNQGICPDGWHLPSDDEWKELEKELGMSQANADATGWRGTDEGGKLKDIGTTWWLAPNTGATNSSGFRALGTGYIHSNHHTTGAAWGAGYWWTSTENNSTTAWYRSLQYDKTDVYRENYEKSFGRAVRCVKD